MTTDNINNAIQTEFTVRFVTDRVTGSQQADFYAHDELRRAWRNLLEQFVLEHGHTHGIVAHEPWVTAPEPVLVPANRRRRTDLLNRFTFNSTQILEMWNNSLRFLSLGRTWFTDAERDANSKRIQKMRGAVVSISNHHYRGDCAVLQEVDLDMLLDSNILSHINDDVQRAAALALENSVRERIDAWLDGELEDGLIARIREEEVNSKIDAYFHHFATADAQRSSTEEPF